MSNAQLYPEVGTGVLSRLGAWFYCAVVLEILVVVTSLPGMAGLLFLDRSPSNLPLVVACLLPVGPSLAACLFAWHHWATTPPSQRDLRPAAAFWRGWRLNWRDVLLWWVPMLVVLALLGSGAVNAGLVYGDARDGHVSVSTLAYLALAVMVLVWSGNALVLTSLFSFRTRDVARLAAFYLAAKPVVGLGVLGLLVVGTAGVLFVGDGLLLVSAAVLASLLLRTSRPMVHEVRTRFVAPGPSGPHVAQ
ncbi:MAG TPA: glycosyl transferase [Cellulomonas sp.]